MKDPAAEEFWLEVAHVAMGRQDTIKGGGTVATFDNGVDLVGVVLPAGTWVYRLFCAGAQALDATLGFSAWTGATPAASIVPTGADWQTAKTGAVSQAFDAFVAGTPQTKSIATLRGERYVLMTITVPPGATATVGKAEYSCL